MVASSSTFQSPGEGQEVSVLSVACCTEWYGSTTVHSNYPREAAGSKCLAYNLVFRRYTLVPQFNSGANTAPASVQAVVLAVVGP